MSTLEFANLEHASRRPMAGVAQRYQGHPDYAALAAALGAAAGILAVAATLLFSVL